MRPLNRSPHLSNAPGSAQSSQALRANLRKVNLVEREVIRRAVRPGIREMYWGCPAHRQSRSGAIRGGEKS
jgi:hypothetical protein